MTGKRWWRLALLGRNPLVRPVDRLESALLGVAFVLILVAVPFALALGSETYVAQRAAAVAATADRQQASAVLLADTPPEATTPQGVPVNDRVVAQAVWRLPDGTDRTGTVTADRGTAKGTTVPIWLDRAGNPVAPPPRPDDALIVAITVTVVSWLGFAGVVGGAFAAVRFLLNRHRRKLWDREWAVLRIGHSHS